ncbi:NAD(P)H-dependent oxidoreductase [Pontivivens ytuae]|uniref:NAD(P)H-dependent oxidoreductase n=1 Tax=Pontivivens ytuae TaxID=2789856 RepID=A0A7S9QBK8_9RHOB|nr:NAD(P)H-dependent oxidoreductase [Pontivivens ytuae]QPH53268.1 NAD(P)H-dependent oxidoreductase [Pontivivens ytuae]
MARVLVLHAHPGQRHSAVNRAMLRAAREIDGITVVDLYAAYPRFKIDVDAEQKRLGEHDVIVFQFPFYWYSTPSLLKEWQDLVLEYGWAYGPRGNALRGKVLQLALTTGGSDHSYSAEGHNRFSLRQLTTPLEQTADLCGLTFAPPFVLFAAHHAREDGRQAQHVEAWRALLTAHRDDRFDMGSREPVIGIGTVPVMERG